MFSNYPPLYRSITRVISFQLARTNEVEMRLQPCNEVLWREKYRDLCPTRNCRESDVHSFPLLFFSGFLRHSLEPDLLRPGMFSGVMDHFSICCRTLWELSTLSSSTIAVQENSIQRNSNAKTLNSRDKIKPASPVSYGIVVIIIIIIIIIL